MLPEYQRKTNVGVGIGIVLQVAAMSLVWTQTRGIVAIFALPLILISIPVFIWGGMNYAEGKGHSKWVGLVGLAGIIGLMVLIILPDQDREGLVVYKLISLISVLLGMGILATGRYLHDLGNASIYEYENVHFEFPWPGVCMFLGTCLVIGSLIFLLLTREKSND